MSDQFDVVVIGAGPGGYVAAIRAAQLGLSTAIIEKENVGGVCLNWGCIPSKNLIQQAEDLHTARGLKAIGGVLNETGIDYGKAQKNSRKVAKTLSGGINFLLKKNNVEQISGTAKVTAPGEVTLDSGDVIKGKNILVATGSRPMQIPGFEFDEQSVLSSNGILSMTELPKSIVILGAGAIGCEFAYVLNTFGVEVTLVELADHILPTEDFETCEVLQQSFEKAGIKVLTKTRATALHKGPNGVLVDIEDEDGDEDDIVAEKALVVFGRVPNTEEIGLRELGVELDERGYVTVGDYNQTRVDGIYAIGDITRTPALAHVASREGEIAVEHMAGHEPKAKNVDADLVPSAVYCEPQVAGFGLREDKAEKEGIPFKKATFPLRAVGKAVAVGKTDGLVKTLVNSETNEILGAHIVGHNATEMIHQILLAKTNGLKPEDITAMIHAHPTLSEAIMEQMLGIDGKPIHI